MLQVARHGRFRLKARHQVLSTEKLTLEHFDGYIAVQFQVVRHEQLAQSTFASSDRITKRSSQSPAAHAHDESPQHPWRVPKVLRAITKRADQ